MAHKPLQDIKLLAT